RELEHRIARAAELEGADLLEVFTLEKQRPPRQPVERSTGHHRSSVGKPGDALGRVADGIQVGGVRRHGVDTSGKSWNVWHAFAAFRGQALSRATSAAKAWHPGDDQRHASVLLLLRPRHLFRAHDAVELVARQ